MLSFSQVIQLFNSLFDWLKLAAGEKGRLDAETRAALLKVYVASNETKAYVTGLKLRKHADREREARLARLWTEAAVALRHLDRDLADKCLLQGDALAGSMNWSHAQIDDARNHINEVFQHARKLL